MRRWILGALGIVTLAAITLIGYGLVDNMVITPRRPVAIVGEVEIPLVDFEKAVRYRRVQLINEYQSYYQIMQYLGTQEQQYQAPLDRIEVQLDDTVGTGRNTLRELIQHELVRQGAMEIGVTVSIAEVDKQIQSFFGYNPQSASPTPSLGATPDPDALSTEGPSSTPLPSSTPYTEEAFLELYAGYIENLGADTGMTRENVEELFKLQLLESKMRDIVTADVITEEEHVKARHILLGLEDRELAQDVLDRVMDGDSFAQLANELSTDSISAGEEGNLGWFPRGQMVPTFEMAVFSAETGIIPTIVETQFGYHIVEVLGRDIRKVTEEIARLRRDQAYAGWISEQRASSNVSTFDWWESRVPTFPTLEQRFRD